MKSKSSIILLFIVFIQIYTHQTPKNETNPEYKTYLVKTQLTKEQLLTLLNQQHSHQTNLKKTEKSNKVEEAQENNKVNQANEVQEVNNTEVNDDTLEEQIEDEIRADALHPLDEFHVKQAQTSEVKSFVSTNTRFIDSLYEKKFGKIYAYLTLIFFVFALIYFNNLNTNKKIGYKNKNYVNYYEFMSTNDYLVSKNN